MIHIAQHIRRTTAYTTDHIKTLCERYTIASTGRTKTKVSILDTFKPERGVFMATERIADMKIISVADIIPTGNNSTSCSAVYPCARLIPGVRRLIISAPANVKSDDSISIIADIVRGIMHFARKICLICKGVDNSDSPVLYAFSPPMERAIKLDGILGINNTVMNTA